MVIVAGMKSYQIILAGLLFGISGPAIAKPRFIQCSFAPYGGVATYKLDAETRTIIDTDSPNLRVKIVSFTDTQVIFETDNRFYGWTFNRVKGMASLTRVTINRISGGAGATLIRYRGDFEDVCPTDGGWHCIKPKNDSAIFNAEGRCQGITRRF